MMGPLMVCEQGAGILPTAGLVVAYSRVKATISSSRSPVIEATRAGG